MKMQNKKNIFCRRMLLVWALVYYIWRADSLQLIYISSVVNSLAKPVSLYRELRGRTPLLYGSHFKKFSLHVTLKNFGSYVWKVHACFAVLSGVAASENSKKMVMPFGALSSGRTHFTTRGQTVPHDRQCESKKWPPKTFCNIFT